MKPRHAEAYATDARAILAEPGIRPGQRAPDFFTLTPSQVSALEAFADVRRYQKPRNANGSRLRYFYAMLLRRAGA